MLTTSICLATLVNSVPATFHPGDEPTWQRLEKMLDDESKQITFVWEGDGGFNYMATQFNKHVDKAVARGVIVRFLVVGDAISNHANTICHGSSYKIFENGSIIFHPEYNPAMSKVLKHKYYTHLTSVIDFCVEKGIITQSELDAITWMNQRLEIRADGSRTFKPDWPEYE